MVWRFLLDEGGIEYVEWKIERGSKTGSGGQDGQTERAFKNGKMSCSVVQKIHDIETKGILQC